MLKIKDSVALSILPIKYNFYLESNIYGMCYVYKNCLFVSLKDKQIKAENNNECLDMLYDLIKDGVIEKL